MIIETEAYLGDEDPASHAFKGIKERNKPMFEAGGVIYVYFTYGAHYCLNIVTGKKNEGEAVLIRAVQPVAGIPLLIKNRYGTVDSINNKQMVNLTNGPGKLTKAFGIGKEDNYTSVDDGNISLLPFKKINSLQINITQRIGISQGQEHPWRFFIRDNHPFKQ